MTSVDTYKVLYKKLNAAQKQAVDTIDGPLLVIAGPGTGKTQLLSARVAHILAATDTLPENVLCLTFTESGAQNMRERLTRFIGQAAYNVQISTYHAFGGDLIRRYGEYFLETRLDEPVDELGQHQIVQTIVEGMSYRNPLKQTQHHLGDLIGTISEVKRALLTPDDLRAIAQQNVAFIATANRHAATALSGLVGTTSFAKAMPHFEALLVAIAADAPPPPAAGRFASLASMAITALQDAVATARTLGKTTPLTQWKNTWLVKDESGHFIFDGTLQNERIRALADACEAYQSALSARGLYDFDDMILRSIAALEAHPDFRFTLQERYQYILLDEFQDTNAAQLRLIQLLTDNPVNEGRPNVMAVGDDDQAIYAFQGAQYSNMLDFYHMYRDVVVVNLTENYRSHADILLAAQNVAAQISARLHTHFAGMSKTLHAANTALPKAQITRIACMSDIGQFVWIAQRMQHLIANGVKPSEIAVLAPKHKHLEPLVAYLNDRSIPVRYEKRENILETPVIVQLITMSRLLRALQRGNRATANALWPQVLSFAFWRIPVSTIWQLAWQVRDNERQNWHDVALAHEATRPAALLLLALASHMPHETCEQMLDYLIGNDPITTNESDTPTVRSPLRDYYTDTMAEQPDVFYDALSHLTVLRARLRDHQRAADATLYLNDLLDMIELYETSGQPMLNTSPYSQAADAVQLMTVFKAKGLEFEHVFLVACQDDVWGTSSRGNTNRLTLPPNLQPIRHAGANDDERLRALFVAITRAKTGLYLTSYRQTFSGKLTRGLKYLDEQAQPDGSQQCMILPEHARAVLTDSTEHIGIEQLTPNWRHRHMDGLPDTQLKQLLQTRLDTYQLSPTHLNTFTDVACDGPQAFFFSTILQFPQAPTLNSQFGSAIHATLEWLQRQLNTTGTMPTLGAVQERFDEILRRTGLTPEQFALQTERGHHALQAYLADSGTRFVPSNVPEHNFRGEGVFAGSAHLGGKIDLLEIDTANRAITVVDYKTGAPHDRWKADARLHKYKQQLYTYKLLVERSHSFNGYTVSDARLEFVVPNGDGRIHRLALHFDKAELERTEALLQAMWHSVMALDIPDTSQYTKDLKGVLAFEDDLLQKYGHKP